MHPEEPDGLEEAESLPLDADIGEHGADSLSETDGQTPRPPTDDEIQVQAQREAEAWMGRIARAQIVQALRQELPAILGTERGKIRAEVQGVISQAQQAAHAIIPPGNPPEEPPPSGPDRDAVFGGGDDGAPPTPDAAPAVVGGMAGMGASVLKAALQNDPVALLGQVLPTIVDGIVQLWDKRIEARQAEVNPIVAFQKLAERHPQVAQMFTPNPWGQELQTMLAQTYLQGVRAKQAGQAAAVQGGVPAQPSPFASWPAPPVGSTSGPVAPSPEPVQVTAPETVSSVPRSAALNAEARHKSHKSLSSFARRYR